MIEWQSGITLTEDHESTKSDDEFEVIERMSQYTMTTIQDEQQQVEEEPASGCALRSLIQTFNSGDLQ